MKIVALLAMIMTAFFLVSDGHWWGGWLAVPIVWLSSITTYRDTEGFWSLCFGICVLGGTLMGLNMLFHWLF